MWEYTKEMTLLASPGIAPRGKSPARKDLSSFCIQRPFLSVWVAASVLNCSEHRVACWMQDGTLPFAFNIARPGVRRACVRLSTAALQGCLSGAQPFAGLPEFLEAVFPPAIATYAPAQLAWMMQCDYDHIYNLIRARALADVGRESYEVPRPSLLRFLNERTLS
jgi:hypothetical protein